MPFEPLTLLILNHRGRSIAVFREQCNSHAGLLAVARRTFPSLQAAGNVVVMAPIPGYPDTEPVELLPEIWTTICHVTHRVTVVLESERQSTSSGTTACDSPVSSNMHLAGTPTHSSLSPPLPPQQEHLSISGPPPIPDPPVQSQTQQSSDNGPKKKKKKKKQSSDVPQAIESRNPFRRSGPASIDINELSVDFLERGRKPVIYLYPPSSLADVIVELALASSWRFSAVHPPPQTTVPPGEPHTAQSLIWVVTAEPNGTLVDKTSGMEVSYLYWEAIANSQLATPGTSRASSPMADTETFDPAHPSVNPGNSVLLPTSKVPGYLDVALKALALHTEARTSFITFWLPDMLKHEYIALRFLAQDVYEQAAPMQITPAPDVVTRVFMLFRGVAAGDLGLWEAASARAEAAGADGPRFWADVVGVDATRAADSGLFRVLEWGGMEVQSGV